MTTIRDDDPASRTPSTPTVLMPDFDSTVAPSDERPFSLPRQDLTQEELLLTAPRLRFGRSDSPSLGRIPLIAKLGQGGMGAVYYGIHPRLDNDVAVKVLMPKIVKRDPAAIQRFFDEAKLAVLVKSSFLVGVIDVDKETRVKPPPSSSFGSDLFDDHDPYLFYIVMEYVDGMSAKDYLRDTTQDGSTGLREIDALEICIAGCKGLAAAHAKGIIHRDVKPDNILIPRGDRSRALELKNAKLSDLGLARKRALNRVVVGACMGTPGYMPPEQAMDAENVGRQADVFSMGATLYALLAGTAPFTGRSNDEVLFNTCNVAHFPIHKNRPDVSPATAALIDRCLLKKADGRYADADELQAELESCRAALNTLRIVVSGADDVSEECDQAGVVIEQLQAVYGARVKLIPARWKEFPLKPEAGFEDGVNVVRSAEHGVDLAVFVLWSSIGETCDLMRKTDGTPFRGRLELELSSMLEARRRSFVKRPRMLAFMRQDNDSFRDVLNTVNPASLADRLEQQRLTESLIQENFLDNPGRSPCSSYSYDKPLTFAGRLKVHLRTKIDEILGDATTAGRHWDQDPYRGLQVFDLEHAPIFFGREHEICELQELLRRRAKKGCAFAVIVGTSGSGKSSLARAGVASAFVRYNLDKSVKQWRLAVMQPGAVAGSPMAALADALSKPHALPELLADGAQKEAFTSGMCTALASTLEQAVWPAFARAKRKAGGDVKLLLILDQTEELWTDSAVTPKARDEFLTTIETLAKSGSVWVLATLRTDFYPRAQDSETFLRLKGNDGGYDLTAPQLDALHRIIIEPARLAGVQFERNDTTGETLDIVIRNEAPGLDALPLLEYALDQLFKATGPKRVLTYAAYEKMERLEGALGKRAEEEFSKLPADVQAAFGDVMKGLVTVDAEGQAVRRTALLDSLTNTDARMNLVNALVNQRLLTTGKEGGKGVVRVAHEALLRRWKKLMNWIAENSDKLRLCARVDQCHERWKENKRETTALLPSGVLLEAGKKLLREAPELLNDETAEYIRLSVQHHALAEQRRKSARRIFMAALSIMLFFALGALAYARSKHGETQNALKEQQLLAAKAERAAREQRSMSFEAVVRNAETDEAMGDSEKVVRALEPYLRGGELAQHPLRLAAEDLVKKAHEGARRLAAFAELVRQGERDISLDLGSGVKLDLILIPAGTFLMGSLEMEKGHSPDEKLHNVTISKPFYMGKYHVTQEQYSTVSGAAPSLFRDRPSNPVERVTWFDAVRFCDKLNKLSGSANVRFALPTEAQWEYACRATTSERFYFGDDERDLAKFAWYGKKGTSGEEVRSTRPVTEKNKPNKFGLHDMHGNVFDWCQDWFDSRYYSVSPTEDPLGPKKGEFMIDVNGPARVTRGGAWSKPAEFCRSAYRGYVPPDERNSSIGFRLVVQIPKP